MEWLGSRSGGTIARNAESLMRPSGPGHQHRVRANRVGLVRVGPRSGTRREPVWGSGSPARMNPLGVLRAFRFPAAEGRRGRRAPARRGGGSAASVRSASRSSSGPRTRGGRRRSLRPRRRRPPRGQELAPECGHDLGAGFGPPFNPSLGPSLSPSLGPSLGPSLCPSAGVSLLVVRASTQARSS